MTLIKRAALAALVAAGLVAATAHAQEAAIRKTLAERLPQLGKIDEINKTPMSGLFEVRVGIELFYTDADGNFLIQGNLIDTKQQRNLTEERMDKLLAIDFVDAAGQGCVHHRARQRQAQDGGVRRSELRLLQALRARPAEGRQRHRLHVPLPDPGPGLDRQVAQHLVRQGQGARPGWTGWCATRPRRRPAATPPPWRATSSSARSTRSPARRRWCSPTARRVPGAIGAAAGREAAGRRQAVIAPLPRGASIHYRVEAADLHAHLFRVTLSIDQPAAQQRVSLPVWIPGQLPGARVLQAPAAAGGAAGGPRGRGAATGQVQLADRVRAQQPAGAELRGLCLRQLGAHRLAGRAARLLQRHQPVPEGARPGKLGALARAAAPSRACGHWEAATGLVPHKVGKRGFGTYLAADYDELVDCPVEMGAFWSGEFKAGGVPHRLVVAGATESFDSDRLLADVHKICETEIRFWHDRQAPAAQELPVHAQRGGRRLRRAGASQLHRADRLAARPAAAGRGTHERRLRHAAGPDQPRVLPHLERQAPAAGGVRALRLHAARTTRSCSGSSRASPATTTTCCCAAPA